jgi:gluconate 5-dehydrogenase
MSVSALFDLSSRVAVVTGASSGIGDDCSRSLSGRAWAGRPARIELEERARNRTRRRAASLPFDLADRRALRACAARASEFFGAPDILVSAAGVNVRKPMLDVTEQDWDATLGLNLDAPFFLAQSLAPAMIAKSWGRIINVASLQSVRAFANSAPYGASKSAIMQLTRAQAEAWSRHGVNANAIAPGFFATSLTASVASDPGRWEQMAARTFVGRNGELRDLWGAAVFLASSASDYITGQTIFVDGGFSAG